MFAIPSNHHIEPSVRRTSAMAYRIAIFALPATAARVPVPAQTSQPLNDDGFPKDDQAPRRDKSVIDLNGIWEGADCRGRNHSLGIHQYGTKLEARSLDIESAMAQINPVKSQFGKS
jgi:hypothetical protein